MTTIVRHRKTGNQYILLGINGEENNTNSSRFINELFNSSQQKAEVSCSATVCDARGNLFLAYIDDLVVVEIDGEKPSDILPESGDQPAPNAFYEEKDSNFPDEESAADSENVAKANLASSGMPRNSYVSEQNDFEDDDDEDWI